MSITNLPQVRAAISAQKTTPQNVSRPQSLGVSRQQEEAFQQNRFSTQTLAFPEKVDDKGLGNHGHYIMFYINTQTKAKLRTAGLGQGGSNPQNNQGGSPGSAGNAIDGWSYRLSGEGSGNGARRGTSVN